MDLSNFSPQNSEQWNQFIKQLHGMTKNKYTKMFKAMEYDVVKTIYEKANEVYFNKSNDDGDDDSIMNDSVFDILETVVKGCNVEKESVSIGETPREHQKKETLPFFMPSMNKIKYSDVDCEKQLEKWFLKYRDNPFVISEKLDGVSCLYTYVYSEKKIEHHLYTRGNGTIGTNIDHFINEKYMPTLALFSKFMEKEFKKTVVLRGELILRKKLFNPEEHGTTGRNFVAGVVNSKTINPEHSKIIDFVIYELVSPRLSIEKQMIFVDTLVRDFGNDETNIKCVSYSVINGKNTKDDLLTSLTTLKMKSDYECDGIIIVSDKCFTYSNEYKNPEYAFAFKNDDEENFEWSTVTYVEWNVSKNALIKPIVHFEPVIINNVTIECATGFNAAFIRDNGINKGTRVCVKRSGDVIPIICFIDGKTKQEPSMPTIKYEWNDTEKDIRFVFENDNTDEQNSYKKQFIVKQLHNFTKKLGVKHLGESNIEKCVEKFKIKNIYEFCILSKNSWLMVDGVKEKNAEKFTIALQEALTSETLTLPLLMDATNCFGASLGMKKLQMICDNKKCFKLICDYLKEAKGNHEKKYFKKILHELNETMYCISGFGNVSINDFINNFNVFYDCFHQLCSIETHGSHIFKMVLESNNGEKTEKIEKCSVTIKGSVVFTGFRNKEIEDELMRRGYTTSNTISKNTKALIVKDKIKMSVKMTKASEMTIPIYTCDDCLANLT